MPGNFLKNYFTYSRRERNSIILLLAIIFIIIIVNVLLPLIINNQEFNYKQYESELENFEKSLKPKNKQRLFDADKNSYRNKYNKNQLFRFNPNTVNIYDLKKLGFDETVIKNVIKYRNKGGFFHKKEDLLKIYDIDTSLYYRLVPYIYFNQNGIEPLTIEDNYNSSNRNSFKPVNINKADTSILRELFGIENLLSERVIKYRNSLGGFSNINQFKEIYGIKENHFNLLVNRVFIDTTLIIKININKADEQTLIKHPYLNKYHAKAIIKYKNFIGEIRNINELISNNILPESVFLQIKPYLSIN